MCSVLQRQSYREAGIAIYFIVFEGKKCSSATARECFFPKQTMKYVALNARLSPFKKPTTFFLYFFLLFSKTSI